MRNESIARLTPDEWRAHCAALDLDCGCGAADLAELALVTPRNGPYTVALGHAPVGVAVVCSLAEARALVTRAANAQDNVVPVRIAGGGRTWQYDQMPTGWPVELHHLAAAVAARSPRTTADDDEVDRRAR